MKNLVGRRQRFRRGWLARLLKVAILHGIGWNCGRRLGLSACWRICGSGGKLGELRLWRRGGGAGDERDFADEIVARFQLQGGIREFLEACCGNF